MDKVRSRQLWGNLCHLSLGRACRCDGQPWSRPERAGPERAEVAAGASLLGQGGLVGVHSSLEGVRGVVPSALGVFWGVRGQFTVDTPWSMV